MQLRRLGNHQVSAIGLGGMPMSVPGSPPREQGIETVHAALDSGVTLIDTADAYTPDGTMGHNEELIVEAVRSYAGDTSDVLIATKGGHTRDGMDWGLDGSPAYLRRACEASIERLGVDKIALYQHHRPDPTLTYAETMEGLRALLDDGLIEYAGISNANPEEIRLAHDILGDGLAAVQNQLSSAYRSSLPEVDVCDELGIAFLPWRPLAGMAEAREDGSPHAAFATVADRHGISTFQTAIAWLLNLSPLMIPIPGASKPSSIAASAAVSDVRLSADDMRLLNAAG